MTPGDTLYLSHSGNRREDPDWWIVEPRDGGAHLRRAINRLLRVDRRVIQLVIHPCGAEVHEVFPDTADVMLRHLEHYS